MTIDEQLIIKSIVGSVVNRFQSDLFFEIENFYKKYDPLKSLDKTFVVKMMSSVYLGLEKILNEVQK